MCGIVGIIGNRPVSDRIINSLYRLEYRGYDSAGVATIVNGGIEVRRIVGKIRNLENEVISNPITGEIGIGHTRWATHGAPATKNAHPIQVDGVCVVHNGIIENHNKIREDLKKEGYVFNSDTDTEVVPSLISSFLKKGHSEIEAAKEAAKVLEGAFALAIIFASKDNLMIALKKGSPLAIGLGDDEMYVGSDALALSPFTNRVVYLEDNDIAILDRHNFQVTNKEGEKLKRESRTVSADASNVSKDGHEHFMLKEILQQPQVLAQAFSHYYDTQKHEFKFHQLAVNVSNIDRIYIVACGTSYYTAAVAKYWFERLAKIPVEIDISSEFRYRSAIISKNSLSIFISQSGETADTLWALKYANEQHNSYNVALVNVVESSIAHAANAVLPICAGYEIGVASTKAFTAQLTVLLTLCLYICQQRNTLTEQQLKDFIFELHNLPDEINAVLAQDKEMQAVSKIIMQSSSMLYVGRDVSYPVALEGALKMKELSYIHAEGIAAGELKHGPIALIDDQLPIVVLAPSDDLFGKIASNVHEISSRSGKIITFTDKKGLDALKDISSHIVKMPDTTVITSPIVYSIAMQLLAYHTSNMLGRDVDQPRNLAKSVTVE